MDLVGMGPHTSIRTNSKSVETHVAIPFGNGDLCCLLIKQWSLNERS